MVVAGRSPRTSLELQRGRQWWEAGGRMVAGCRTGGNHGGRFQGGRHCGPVKSRKSRAGTAQPRQVPGMKMQV